MNILLIEDDKMLLKALSYKLAESGHRVFQAENGKKAVDMVVDNTIDIIICDLMVPIISGITFLRLRKKFMPSEIPVIVMSVLDDGEKILKTLQVDFGFFIKKPVQFEQLLELVNRSGSKNNTAKLHNAPD